VPALVVGAQKACWLPFGQDRLMRSGSGASLFLSYATALATFSAAAVALGLLRCLNRRQRLTSVVILAFAMLGIASALIAVSEPSAPQQPLNVLIALGFVATAGYVLFAALSLIFMTPHAQDHAAGTYRLWAHREGTDARRQLALTFILFLGALTTLFVIATPSLLEHLLAPKPTYSVYGTCIEGGCGLKQRSGPGPTFPEVDKRDRIQDGVKVRVVCQTVGAPPKGFSNRVWDRMPNGRYVSDVFVNTPNRNGRLSKGLPRCRGTRAGAAG
jgi:hypothetical protein